MEPELGVAWNQELRLVGIGGGMEPGIGIGGGMELRDCEPGGACTLNPGGFIIIHLVNFQRLRMSLSKWTSQGSTEPC